MKHVRTPSSNGPWALDRFCADKSVAYELEADTPITFPPVADFPNGGSFLVHVPAGAAVVYRPRPDSDGFPLAPGYWPWVFTRADIAEFEADGAITITAIRNEEN